MTRLSTVYVLMSQASFGPWANEIWRIGFTAQLVEGGGNGPYWLVSPPSGELNSPPVVSLSVGGIDDERVSQSLLLLVTLLMGTEEQKALATKSIDVDLMSSNNNVVRWKPISADSIKTFKEANGRIKLGLVRLDLVSCLNEEAVQRVREFGFEVHEFHSSDMPPHQN